jgi:DNA-binding response OmpR family regulator
VSIKVLCAFQTEGIFDFVKSALQDECEVIKASSEALALFLAQKNFPCLVVSELLLEEGWGINLLAELKADADLCAIPLIFLCRRPADVSLPELDLPQGAAMLMWYPIESYEFYTAVRGFIREFKDERALESPE